MRRRPTAPNGTGRRWRNSDQGSVISDQVPRFRLLARIQDRGQGRRPPKNVTGLVTPAPSPRYAIPPYLITNGLRATPYLHAYLRIPCHTSAREPGSRGQRSEAPSSTWIGAAPTASSLR